MYSLSMLSVFVFVSENFLSLLPSLSHYGVAGWHVASEGII